MVFHLSVELAKHINETPLPPTVLVQISVIRGQNTVEQFFYAFYAFFGGYLLLVAAMLPYVSSFPPATP